MPSRKKSGSKLEDKVARDLAALGMMDCPYCGITFVVNDRRRVTCGDLVCRKQREAQLKKWPLGPGKGWAKGRVRVELESTCRLCGASFHVPQTIKNRKGGGQFCSNNCRTTHMAINPSHYPQTRGRRGRGGKRDDLNGMYFRSSWEANWARYLNFLIANGELKDWEFEADTFQFHEIKRGSRFYTPDFKIYENDGNVVYHEIKGYMDQKSKTKLDRMARYYPQIKIVLIDKSQYKSVEGKVGAIIPGWEKRR